MIEAYKVLLSKHVEGIFRSYTEPGLHICDIATGGGKSYTIGKLTCEFYPKYFDRIVILCVQKKLVDGMNREIDRFISERTSIIKPSDKMVIENNPEVIAKAVRNGSWQKLIEEMDYRIGELQKFNKKVYNLQFVYNVVKKTYEGIASLINSIDNSIKNDYLQSQINEGEAFLRKKTRDFFDSYAKHLEKSGQLKMVRLESILKRFPSLVEAYPQVDYKRKKVLLMTVHKAMYGIDPILSEKIRLQDMAEHKERTLILFDESDQAAVAMRTAIIEQSIENGGGSKRFAKGYNGYLHYLDLIDRPEQIANDYYGGLLEEAITKAQSITSKNWERALGKTIPYKNIFLDNLEELESYRRGVFFSGPALKLNISQRGDNTNSYVCYRKGERSLCLTHAKDDSLLIKDYTFVIPLDKFLSLVISNTTTIKAQLRKVIAESLARSRERFLQDNENVANNTSTVNHYLGYPTLEREIHTLLSRFETTSEFQFEQQLLEFMTNRKNLFTGEGNDKLKLPDFSVYSQGVQLYQEEIDERDNLHRIRLSCREIQTTPEKILIDLVNTKGTSVVLCSATASSKSVVSNFDVTYLSQTLGRLVQSLSKEDRDKFDKLVDKTYPVDHRIMVIPLEKYEYHDKRENSISFPDKYRNMFPSVTIEEGLADKWFQITMRKLKGTSRNVDDMTFQLYRLFQFIEAYFWFIHNEGVHSMLYFQNRTGDKDSNQFHLLSSLIDGSYKDMPSTLDDDIPTDWNNAHIRITKDLEEVETSILPELTGDKDAKLMPISAYGSFKAGTNLQYEIPNELDYVAGDNWANQGETLKKDWDAIYVQSPTAYLMMADDGSENTFEKSLYNAMLTLMMLYERGCLSRLEVSQWLCNALSNNFMFGENNAPGIIKDKTAWAQTTIEQAIGRICRTRNKPHTTYILFDESMRPYFDSTNLEKSLTKEFRTLANFIIEHPKEEMQESAEEVMRCNNANHAQSQLDRLRRYALRYTPHPNDGDDFDDDYENISEVPYNVKVSQIMNQCYKQTIIRKPVISSLDELTEEDKRLTFIPLCYGNWERDDSGCFVFSCETDYHNRLCPAGRGKSYPISPSYVRLDILMKNAVIRDYFERNGFATMWAKDGLILHPQILATDYAGEIGEEAFKAIMIHYTECTEETLSHLEGKEYELADFVVYNADGSKRIAFDVKNMNPKADHNDKYGDMPTSQKREIKRKRLGCELITINMLQLPLSGMDEIREIGGVIDINGNIIPSAIDRLKILVNTSK